MSHYLIIEESMSTRFQLIISIFKTALVKANFLTPSIAVAVSTKVFSHIVGQNGMTYNTSNTTRNYSPREEFVVTGMSMKCKGASLQIGR